MNGPGISEKEEDQRAAEAAAVGAAAQPPNPTPEKVILTNGVVLKLRKVPPLLIQRAQDGIPVPKVPTIYNTQREEAEENPSDPDYQKAVARYEDAVNTAALNVLMLTGTSFESAPEGVEKPEDPGWVEILEALDVPIGTSTPSRYLAWLRYYALQDPIDMLEVMSAVGRITGISEADVLKAVESFRSGQGWRGDPGSAADEVVADGDQLPADVARAGAGY